MTFVWRYLDRSVIYDVLLKAETFTSPCCLAECIAPASLQVKQQAEKMLRSEKVENRWATITPIRMKSLRLSCIPSVDDASWELADSTRPALSQLL
jgi:hypothetical protein